MTACAPHPAALPVEDLLDECDIERLRRSGPGGQHRNKVETAVRITHRPTGVTAMGCERRSQSLNLSQAVFRLRVTLALEVRSPPLEAPSTLWCSRLIESRIQISPKHVDFPALLAEALNAVQAANWNVATAAEFLLCTPSQLLKLLRSEPRALAQVNRQRTAQQQKAYK